MATEFSMIAIMNAALLAQGHEEVSENDGSNEFNVLARNWPSIVEAELEDGNYHFTKKQANLITRTDGKFGYEDGFLVGHDALHVRHLWILNEDGERILVDWIQDGKYVYLNNDEGCWIEYVDVEGVDLWSANFVRGVQMKLEAVILRAIEKEAGEAVQMDQAAEIYFQRARTNSSKARRPQPPYKQGAIARSRFRRRG